MCGTPKTSALCWRHDGDFLVSEPGQWWVIWGVYVVVLLVSVEWTSSTIQTRKPTADEVIEVGQRLLQLTITLLALHLFLP
ncbi:MAG: hypothetical protein HW418_3718 [Anaerolineales bacterium]|nr:hypothetical protein [Anaerolineales bacterium]